MGKKTDQERVLREFIASVIQERHRDRTPGGPRTDIGAVRQLDPGAFSAKVKSAVSSRDGDVESAADVLGVAKRTLYHYLDDDSALKSVETTADRAAHAGGHKGDDGGGDKEKDKS